MGNNSKWGPGISALQRPRNRGLLISTLSQKRQCICISCLQSTFLCHCKQIKSLCGQRNGQKISTCFTIYLVWLNSIYWCLWWLLLRITPF